MHSVLLLVGSAYARIVSGDSSSGPSRVMRVHYERAASLAAVVVTVLLVQCVHVHAAEQLGKYNVNISDSSVSGLSSGGYFAQQMHTAYSSVMRGAGACECECECECGGVGVVV